ncbi:hypothetical protein AALO_G00088930 [Alosa alosa]|uniref:Zinc transporter ZIP11 n=1 Tax=Alosa alosa TaxID=278164 RepID=A0AAV6H4X7_9TELE|nr:hypothetical protein AALO_G00088930 [Alosa alosa]
MLPGYSPVAQALLGTLFTWALTAAGAALVFVFSSRQKRILDGSLGFAAGVMLAASYWSLLAPAIEMAESSQARAPALSRGHRVHSENALPPHPHGTSSCHTWAWGRTHMLHWPFPLKPN